MKISIIIPTLNEEAHLEKALLFLRETATPGSTETIVVDAASHDATATIASRLADKLITVKARGRSAQMHEGAKASSGDILLFLHADSSLPLNWQKILLPAWQSSIPPVATAFPVRFDKQTLLYRFISWGANLRHRFTGIPHGDQGIAVQRSAYFNAGGFPNVPLMEEYELGKKLKTLGKIKTLSASITASTRRYEHNGPLFHAFRNAFLVFSYYLGLPLGVLAKLYRGTSVWAIGIVLEISFLWIATRGDLRYQLPDFFIGYGVAFLGFLWLTKQVLARKTSSSLISIFCFAILFRISLLWTQPSLSDDIYRYIWDGRVQNAGINPYRYAPADEFLSGLRDENYVHINHKDISTIYPPFSQWIFHLAALGPAIITQKTLFVFFDVMTVMALIALLKKKNMPVERVILYAWNPLVVVEIAGSGHFDSIGIFFLITALVFFESQRNISAAISLAFSFLSKFAGLLLVPVLIIGRKWKALLAFTTVVIGAYAIFFTKEAFLFKGAQTYARDWSFNGSLYPLLKTIASPGAAKTAIVLGMVGLGFWGAWRAWDINRLSYVLIGVGILLTPTLHPWYVLWILPFLCLFPYPGWILFSGTIVLSYSVWPRYLSTGHWNLNRWVQFLEYAPLYGFLIWTATREIRKRLSHV